MARDSVCLHAFVSVFVASRWWEWTHMPWQRGHRNPQIRPPPTINHLLSLVHKRPHMTSDPSGIHSDWVKVLTVAQQWTMLSGQWEEEEGGERGGVLYLLSLPPHKPRSRAVSQQARNKRGAFFLPSGGRKELGMVAKRSSPWREKKSFSKSDWGCFWADWSETEGGESGNSESFIHTGRKNTADRDFGAGRSDPKVRCGQITGHFRECHIMTASLGMYGHVSDSLKEKKPSKLLHLSKQNFNTFSSLCILHCSFFSLQAFSFIFCSFFLLFILCYLCLWPSWEF